MNVIEIKLTKKIMKAQELLHSSNFIPKDLVNIYESLFNWKVNLYLT